MTNPQPIYTEWAKLEALPLKTGTEQGYPLSLLLSTPIQDSTGSNKARKRNKGYSNRKTGSQTVSVCRYMILYLENPITSDSKFLKPISNFSKVSGYKINVQ